jgi:hypothetical protein
VLSDFVAVWPAAREVRPIDYSLERIGAAMVAAVPGAFRLRPSARTGIENLILAGDWTRHGLNASMEGATFSARLAANELLSRYGEAPIRILIPENTDLPLPLRALQRGRAWLTTRSRPRSGRWRGRTPA